MRTIERDEIAARLLAHPGAGLNLCAVDLLVRHLPGDLAARRAAFWSVCAWTRALD